MKRSVPNPQRPRILAVSFAFPPLPSPRSVQVSRLLSTLDASVSMICADEVHGPKDVTIGSDVEENLETCIRVPFLVRRANNFVEKLWYQLFRPVRNYQIYTPDQYRSWQQPAVAAITHLIENDGYRPDALVTFAQPFTDHLIGRKLKQDFGLTWIAHFSDPWVDNPFNSSNILIRRKNCQLEKQVVQAADLLVFTSEETRKLVMKKYDAEAQGKAKVLPHCFDAVRFRSTSVANNRNEIVIRHLGDFYGPRSPLPLIKALINIYEATPAILNNVRIELTGLVDEASVEKGVNDGLPPGLITVHKSVPYQESLDLMVSADGLLVIDAVSELSVFLPSKLIDYIGSGRPIFGITPAGTASNLIHEMGGQVADPRAIEQIGDQLVDFIKLIRDRRSGIQPGVWGNEEVRSRFDSRKVAFDFRKLLDETILRG
jgi:hypothetical protein